VKASGAGEGGGGWAASSAGSARQIRSAATLFTAASVSGRVSSVDMDGAIGAADEQYDAELERTMGDLDRGSRLVQFVQQ
jgi:hypothetical protein